MRAVSWGIGLALVGLAVWAVSRSAGALAGAWDAISSAAPGRVGALLVLIAVTPMFTSVLFWVLTRRYGPLGLGENTALITSAWLLNYLPLSPGLFGRLAYLKAVRGIPVGASARAVIWANLLSVVAGLLLLITVGAASLGFAGHDPRLIAATSAPATAIGVLAWYAWRKKPQPDPEVWRVLAGLAIRYVELHIWAARYLIVFSILGVPLSWGGALAVAAVSTLASLFPLAPNGLGLREWAVGLVAPLLPASLAYSAGVTTPISLSAELIHRGSEVLVAVPLGLAATFWTGAMLRAAIRRAPAALQG